MSELRDEIVKFTDGYRRRPDAGYTIVLFGGNGNGKTHTARAVCKWASDISTSLPLVKREDLDWSVGIPWSLFVNWAQAVDNFQKNQSVGVFDEARMCSLLALDDIGAEHDKSKYGSNQLYLILNRRAHRWNIITTNLSKEAWEQTFDRRIASRMHRNAIHIDMSEVPDYNA